MIVATPLPLVTAEAAESVAADELFTVKFTVRPLTGVKPLKAAFIVVVALVKMDEEVVEIVRVGTVAAGLIVTVV